MCVTKFQTTPTNINGLGDSLKSTAADTRQDEQHDSLVKTKMAGKCNDQMQRPLRPAPFFYYVDHSADLDDDPYTPIIPPGRIPTFPAKMMAILNREDLSDIISWSPHGRSWRILKPREFEVRIIPKYFEHSKLSSFVRQANGWGFRRMIQGLDKNCYYHELFLRDMPHLIKRMRRLKVSEKKSADPDHEPDLYAISSEHPLKRKTSPDREMQMLHETLERGPRARMPVSISLVHSSSTASPINYGSLSLSNIVPSIENKPGTASSLHPSAIPGSHSNADAPNQAQANSENDELEEFNSSLLDPCFDANASFADSKYDMNTSDVSLIPASEFTPSTFFDVDEQHLEHLTAQEAGTNMDDIQIVPEVNQDQSNDIYPASPLTSQPIIGTAQKSPSNGHMGHLSLPPAKVSCTSIASNGSHDSMIDVVSGKHLARATQMINTENATFPIMKALPASAHPNHGLFSSFCVPSPTMSIPKVVANNQLDNSNGMEMNRPISSQFAAGFLAASAINCDQMRALISQALTNSSANKKDQEQPGNINCESGNTVISDVTQEQTGSNIEINNGEMPSYVDVSNAVPSSSQSCFVENNTTYEGIEIS